MTIKKVAPSSVASYLSFSGIFLLPLLNQSYLADVSSWRGELLADMFDFFLPP